VLFLAGTSTRLVGDSTTTGNSWSGFSGGGFLPGGRFRGSLGARGLNFGRGELDENFFIAKFNSVASNYLFAFLSFDRSIQFNQTVGNGDSGFTATANQSFEFQNLVQLDGLSGYFNYAKTRRDICL